MASKANLHEQVTEVQLELGPSAHIAAATVLPGKVGHAPGRYQLGNPDLESPAGSREVSRGSAEQAPWTIKVVAQGRG